jgi:hypothetical protein
VLHILSKLVREVMLRNCIQEVPVQISDVTLTSPYKAFSWFSSASQANVERVFQIKPRVLSNSLHTNRPTI